MKIARRSKFTRSLALILFFSTIFFTTLNVVVFLLIKNDIFHISIDFYILLSLFATFGIAYMIYNEIIDRFYSILGADPIDIHRIISNRLNGFDSFEDVEHIEKAEALLKKLLLAVKTSEEQKHILNAEIENIKKTIEAQTKQIIIKERLSIMGEMIANIAHQWRQPLNIISMLVSEIKLDIEFDQFDVNKILKNINDVNFQINFLSNTIDDFRNFFNPSVRATVFNPVSSAHYAARIIKPSLSKKNISLAIHCSEPCAKDGFCEFNECKQKCQVYGYKNELTQVFLNLIKNAVDAIEENGVSEGVIKIDIKLSDGDEYIDITVTDNGGGIRDEIMQKIFTPYFSTKSEKNGTGLGLYMSKQIVEEHHNGELRAFNVEDGACFLVKLPRYKEQKE
jgi:signal transduction histidine kinase